MRLTIIIMCKICEEQLEGKIIDNGLIYIEPCKTCMKIAFEKGKEDSNANT